MNYPPQFSGVFEKLHKCRERRWGWEAHCPAHETDGKHNASLSIAVKNNRLLMRCHRGCSFQQVIQAIGLKASDFFDSQKPRRRTVMNNIEKTYDYRDEEHKLLYQVVRLEGKQFRQRRPEGDGWVWGLGECRRVLYRLPELIANAKKRVVFVPEGEKDVETLVGLGLVATCNPMGAGKWNAGYSDFLKGCHVVVLPDNDPVDEKLGYSVGEQHARDIVESLVGKASSIKIVRLPGLPPKGDVSDWIAAGHTREELTDLVKATDTLYPVPEKAVEKPKEVVEAAPESEPATCCVSESGKDVCGPECGRDRFEFMGDDIIRAAKLIEAKQNLDDEDRRYLVRGIVHELWERLTNAIG